MRKGELVRWRGHPYYQIIKIKVNGKGDRIYKIRYYNSLALFTGTWVAENEIEKMSP